MRTSLTRAVILFSVLCAAANASAQQATDGLARVGPTSPTHGFPSWYQDKTGITLEFCQPVNQLDLDGGWCLLLPGDTTVPEAFPTPFADEHFFFAADASIATPQINALLVLGLEAAFAVGPVIQGDQMVFARIRFRFDAPATGTYTIYHPYGQDTVEAVQGERVFFTEDLGIQCPRGDFSCALNGRMGPFLLPSAAPGGSELPPVTGPSGKLHIADPNRLGPVTGSPIGQNYFRIVGPGIDVTTTDFSLMGRIFNGQMPGRVTLDKARYARLAGSADGKLDVFATAFAAAQPRLPGFPIVGALTPFLAFYPAPCGVGAGGLLTAPAGATAIQMFNTGSRYYATTQGAIPASVCVSDLTARDLTGANVPVFYQTNVADQVTITRAEYNPAGGGVLTVEATSSDAFAPPVLTAFGVGPLVGGTVSGVVGVPALKATVTSSAGGRADLEVSTLSGNPDFPDVPVPTNDAITISEDSGPVTIPVLQNDTIGGILISDPNTVTINIQQAPVLGTISIANGVITYTPSLNRNGTDVLVYTLSMGTGPASPPAFVSVNITAVPDAPVANDDAIGGVGNLPVQINLIANDTDVDGPTDIVGVNIVSAPTGTATVVGGTLTFTGIAGTHTVTYQARDAAGLLSNIATVTITLRGGENIQILRAEYIQNKRRWRVEGITDVASAQTVYVMYADGLFANGTPAVGTLIGQTAVDAAGLWALDFALAGTNDPRNPTSGLFAVRPTRVYVITTIGGTSQAVPFVLR